MIEVTFNKVFGKKVIFSWIDVRYKGKKLKAEVKSSSGGVFTFCLFIKEKAWFD